LGGSKQVREFSGGVMSVQPSGPVRPRRFGNPLPSGPLLAQRPHGQRSNQPFEPLPRPTGAYPYRLSLVDTIPGAAEALAGDRPLVFHCVGDTGGIKDPAPQMAVAAAMEGDLHPPDGGQPPLFFYHLGDVVYFFGERTEYYPQFYEPYATFTVPVFAIPGNHDGAVALGATDASLAGFVENFCATDPHLTPEAEEVDRHAMTQPNVYWTLLTPRVTIIGLYSNVPEGGRIQNDQAAWLREELAAAAPELPVFVTLHHPVYSLDGTHGGDPALQRVLDAEFAGAGRVPDAVFCGHVHNYQRFVRDHDGRQVPYIVAGAGGYHNLHRVAAGAGWQTDGVRLASHCDDRYGFLRVTVTKESIEGEYVAVPRTGPVTRGFDRWTLDLVSHRVT
jgi:hypothetical protein